MTIVIWCISSSNFLFHYLTITPSLARWLRTIDWFCFNQLNLYVNLFCIYFSEEISNSISYYQKFVRSNRNWIYFYIWNRRKTTISYKEWHLLFRISFIKLLTWKLLITVVLNVDRILSDNKIKHAWACIINIRRSIKV